MKPYSITFKPSVEKELKSLPKELVSRIMKKIENLAINPFPHQVVKLSSTEQLYRIPVGEYRIIYEVNTKDKEIIIHYARHRREAYRNL
jgi:mRNA interferase RelE/StbE